MTEFYVRTQGGLRREFEDLRAAEVYAALMRRDGWPAVVIRMTTGRPVLAAAPEEEQPVR